MGQVFKKFLIATMIVGIFTTTFQPNLNRANAAITGTAFMVGGSLVNNDFLTKVGLYGGYGMLVAGAVLVAFGVVRSTDWAKTAAIVLSEGESSFGDDLDAKVPCLAGVDRFEFLRRASMKISKFHDDGKRNDVFLHDEKVVLKGIEIPGEKVSVTFTASEIQEVLEMGDYYDTPKGLECAHAIHNALESEPSLH